MTNTENKYPPEFPQINVEIVRFSHECENASKAYGQASGPNSYACRIHDGQDLNCETFLFAKANGEKITFPAYKVDVMKTNKDGSRYKVGEGWPTKSRNGYKLKMKNTDKNVMGDVEIVLTTAKAKVFDDAKAAVTGSDYQAAADNYPPVASQSAMDSAAV